MQHTIKYDIFPDLNLIVAKASGEISFEQVNEFIQQLFADERHRIGMNCFYDSTEVTSMSGDLMAYQAAADLVSDPDVVNKTSKTAILIKENEENQNQFVEGFILMASASNVEHKAFTETDLSDALAFIGIETLPDW